MSTVWIRVTYGAVLAALLAFTVIFGIAMATPGPKPPPDPGITFRQLAGDDSNSSGQNRLQAQVDQLYGDAARYREDFPTYQRNVFLAASGFAVLIVLIGLALPAAVNYLRWGMVLGGLLLLGYAFWMGTRPVPETAPEVITILSLLGTGNAPQLDFASRFVMFAVAFIGLILALFVGLWRLTEWSAPQRRPAAVAPSPSPAAAAPTQWAPPPSTPVSAGVVAATAPPAQWAPPPAPAPAQPATAPPPASTETEATEKTVEVRAPEWRRPESSESSTS